jgi:hypothetical protein
LRKLELIERRQIEKADEWYCQLIVRAVAFYLGKPTAGETLEKAYARGLGYPNEYEYSKALSARGLDFTSRVASAYFKLREKFGVSPQARTKAVLEAYVRMKEGLPTTYKQELFEFARTQNRRPVVQGFERKQSLLEIVEELMRRKIEEVRREKLQDSVE